MKNVSVRFIGMLAVVFVLNCGFSAYVGSKATPLDEKSGLSRSIEKILQGVKDNGAQGLSAFELGEYATLFLTEKAHEIVFNAYRIVGREPILMSITDPAYKTAQMLLHQSFMSRLRPKDQSPQDIIQVLKDIAENDTDAIATAVRAALNISALKVDKMNDLLELQAAQAKVQELEAKIAGLQKSVEPTKQTTTPAKQIKSKK